ncbi:MAG: MltA domain-containing protein [Nitrospirae bacterium]|nr:MltA domain-containing protein [Nitrospirota bacterium]
MKHLIFYIFVILSIAACSHVKPEAKPEVKPVEKPVIVTPLLTPSSETMVKLTPENYPQFELGDYNSLKEAINRDLKYLNHQAKSSQKKSFNYGKDVYSAGEIKESLIEFLALMELFQDDNAGFNNEIKKRFIVYRSTGSDGVGRTLFTGYYVPEINGSLKKNEVYRYPVYTTPKDLIPIDLGLFSDKFKGKTILARYTSGKILPYYTNEEIFDGALDEKGLELFWVDDRLKLFFMQIQGSGVIKLEDGSEINLGYAGSNGHIYKGIGKYFIDKGYITTEEMSMQSIISYLKQHPEELDNALFYNPSYVFFKKTNEIAFGSLGVQLVSMRSIATDQKIFPKAALAYIQTSKPLCNEKGEITGWCKFSQFVLNQDTGGAIKGKGRVDIFWGTGDYAEIAAGNLKNMGELYFLIKK